MYNSIFAILLVLSTVSTFAQSKLKVFLSDRSQISVEVDGKHFPKNGTTITVNDLPVGRHNLKIYEFGKNLIGRRYEDLIYQGRIKTNYGNITIFELDPITGNINVYDENIDSFNNNPVIRTDTTGVNRIIENNQTSGLQLDTKRQELPVNVGTLTENKLNNLKVKVDDKNADSHKIKILKEGLVGEKISTIQAGMMLDWLSFESSKVEFAQWVFEIVADKDNFGSLETKFSYENYRQDFDNFIKKH